MHEVKIGELKARCNGPENRLKVIPQKMTFKEANKRLAKSRRPPLSQEIFEDTLRWMREDRTDQWIEFKN